jgi:glutathione-regulated potassium-efflux system ancillary protein KefG
VSVQVVNYAPFVFVDPEDLLNAREAAALLGLAHREAIATYRKRYQDFPEPLLAKGTCVLWLRQDLLDWLARRGRGE